MLRIGTTPVASASRSSSIEMNAGFQKTCAGDIDRVSFFTNSDGSASRRRRE